MTATMIGRSQEPATLEWCTARQHPFVTYNPDLDVTLCRCAGRQQAGEHPVDWQAKHEIFHDHPQGAPCSCYVRDSAALRGCPR